MRQMASIDKGHCIVGPDISSETETTNLPEDWCHSQGSLRGQFFLLPSRTFVITHHKMVGSRKWSVSTCLVKTPVTAVGRSAGQEPILNPCSHFRSLSARNGTFWPIHHWTVRTFEVPLPQAKLACNETRVRCHSIPSIDEGIKFKTHNGDIVRLGMCGNMRKLFSISGQSKPGLDSVLLHCSSQHKFNKAIPAFVPHKEDLLRSLMRPAKHEFFSAL